jgi:AAA domain-containing protein
MRTALQLLRLALGNPTFEDFQHNITHGLMYFDAYHVALPLPEYRGFPPEWVFAVLKPVDASRKSEVEGEIINEGRRLCQRLYRDCAVVFVSEDRHFRLGEEFNNANNVFCLDALDLPRQETLLTTPRNAPFVLAVRNKLKLDAIRVFFCPYQRSGPVTGWRFFGRKSELHELVFGHGNFAVVGGRRVGKTSFLQEAKRQLEEHGHRAFLVDVQHCQSEEAAINEITRSLSPKEHSKAIMHSRVMGESLLNHILRLMTRGKETTVLILDELGNVLTKQSRQDWSFFGQLRRHSQNGRLRVVFSCFQEIFLKQQDDFKGPLVNFADTIRLGGFGESEAEDFVLGPLQFWNAVSDKERREIMGLVTNVVGRHPFSLQCFCDNLFQGVTFGGAPNILQAAKALLEHQEVFLRCFREPVHQIFSNINEPVLQYLFLRRCADASQDGQALVTAEIDDEWIKTALAGIGYSAPFALRRNLLEGLEVHGLSVPESPGRHRQMISVPVIYHFLKREQMVGPYLTALREDISLGTGTFRLIPNVGGGEKKEMPSNG